ncbi:MAG: AAA domain-containing protein [Oscillospiraceae bacterium]|nr:AAA domain-containing protein [Oscillospiraceae bacterium]
MDHPYPFTAIVGQEQMKLALILNLINPALGGVLIRGEKGTAKSTAVRGLTGLLEQVEVVEGCPFHCRPDSGELCRDCREKKHWNTVPYTRRVVELPVSSTEDRVVGSLNMEQAIKKGEKVFEPGLLAQANGNILYVDEINLLDDHIVDVLLDSAAMGVNTVEREGISYSHPARFVLVGTMNPEEGDLRPQLLDRFGLVVEIRGEQDMARRSELIRRRMDYETGPAAFCAKWSREEREWKEKIRLAQRGLSAVEIPDSLYLDAAKTGAALQVDGHRADITLLKAARTLAAFEGEPAARRDHLIQVAPMVLSHRMRRQPFDTTDGLPENWERVLDG